MVPARADEDVSASFVSDDKQRRLEFGRELAGYVRGHCERWDITAVLEPLQLLGARPAMFRCTCTSARWEAWQ